MGGCWNWTGGYAVTVLTACLGGRMVPGRGQFSAGAASPGLACGWSGEMSQEPDTASTDMTSQQPATDRRHSRRALFAGAVGAGVGAAAAMVAGAQPASAADGDTVTVGGSFTGTATTSISTSGGSGLAGSTSDASGAGISGLDTSSGGRNRGQRGLGQWHRGTGIHHWRRPYRRVRPGREFRRRNRGRRGVDQWLRGQRALDE